MAAFRILGRIVDSRFKQGVAELRVEAWDQDLIFNDYVGDAQTDLNGTFQIEFDETYFRECFLDRRPDLFFKVFLEDELIKTTKDSVVWNIQAGEQEIVIEVNILPPVESDVLFAVEVMTQVELKAQASMDAQVIAQLLPGETLKILGEANQWYRVRTLKGQVGWLVQDNLLIVCEALAVFLGEVNPTPFVEQEKLNDVYKILDALPGLTLQERENRKKTLDQLLNETTELDLLTFEARSYLKGNPNAEQRFISLLNFLVERENPPPRPASFEVKPFGSASKTGFSFFSDKFSYISEPPRFWRGLNPCVINLPFVGYLTLSVMRLSQGIGDLSDSLVQDAVWTYLWTVNRSIQKIEGLEFLRTRAQEALASKVGLEQFPIAFDLVVNRQFEQMQFKQLATQVSFETNFNRTTNFPLVPGFPGFRAPGLPIDYCRAEQWDRTERAVRCACGLWYQVDNIMNLSSFRPDGSSRIREGCIGDWIEIQGRGFGDSRFSALESIRSEVLFPGVASAGIPATEYDDDNWSDTRIRVRVPEGVRRSGDLSINILCTRNLSGESIRIGRCPIQWRNPRGNRFFSVVTSPTIEFSASIPDQTVEASASEARSLLAEACTPVVLSVLASGAENIRLENSRGILVRSYIADRERFTDSITVDLANEETYTLFASNFCGSSTRLVLLVERFKQVRLQLTPTSTTAGSMVEGLVRISCPPERIDRDEVIVTLDRRGSNTGIIADIPDRIAIARGETQRMFSITTNNLSCGSIEITGDALDHRQATARLSVVPVAITSTFTGTFTLRINDPSFSGPFEGILTLTVDFRDDRSTLTITSLPPITAGPFDTRGFGENTTTVTLVRGGTGTYSADSGVINIPITLFFDNSIDFEPGVREDATIDFVLTTGSVTSPTGIFTLSGSPADPATGVLTLVGASQFSGSSAFVDVLGGKDCSITISGTLSPSLPSPCTDL